MNKKKIFIGIGIFLLIVILTFVVSEIKNNVLCEPHFAGHTLYICRDSLYEKLFVKKECPEVVDSITINAYDKNEDNLNERGLD